MKKALIIFAAVLLFVVVSILSFFYFYNSSEKINIVNQSEVYSAKLNDSEDLQKTLNEWNFWKEKNIYLETGGDYRTAKNITIYVTDEQQRFHMFKDEKTGEVIYSTNEYFENNGNLILKVHINPKYAKIMTDANLERAFLFTVISRLADMSLINQTDDEKFDSVAEQVDHYADNEIRPFVTTRN